MQNPNRGNLLNNGGAPSLGAGIRVSERINENKRKAQEELEGLKDTPKGQARAKALKRVIDQADQHKADLEIIHLVAQITAELGLLKEKLGNLVAQVNKQSDRLDQLEQNQVSAQTKPSGPVERPRGYPVPVHIHSDDKGDKDWLEIVSGTGAPVPDSEAVAVHVSPVKRASLDTVDFTDPFAEGDVYSVPGSPVDWTGLNFDEFSTLGSLSPFGQEVGIPTAPFADATLFFVNAKNVGGLQKPEATSAAKTNEAPTAPQSAPQSLPTPQFG